MILTWKKTIEEKPTKSGWFMTYDYDEHPRPAYFEYCDKSFKFDYCGNKFNPEFWSEIITPELPAKQKLYLEDIEDILNDNSSSSPEYGVSERIFQEVSNAIIELIEKK